MPISEDFYPIPGLQNQNKISSYDFDMGSLLFKNGSFTKSLPHLEKAMSLFLEKQDYSGYLICYNMIIQILSEFGDMEAITKLKQEVEGYFEHHNISSSVRVLTCSAYYNIYVEKNMKQAKKELDKALKIVFEAYEKSKKADDQLMRISTRIEIISCLYCYSMYYYHNKENEKCSRELQNVTILLEDLLKQKTDIEIARSKTDNIQKLQMYNITLQTLNFYMTHVQGIQMAVKYTEANIELYAHKYERSKKLLWELYEEVNKTNYNLFIPYIFISMAWNCIELKNKKQAKMFFNLAEKNITEDRKNLILFMDDLRKKLELDQTENSKDYDIIFDLRDHTIVEKEKGCIELKNQFILMDLLKLFLENPGVSYSKEEIVAKIWKQNYTSEAHDNKIYVTIKRLREIIETNSCKPKYICRDNVGYFFSKQAKALVKPEET